MMEFRGADHLDNPDTSGTIEGCPTIDDAFVELYASPLGKGQPGVTSALPGTQRSYLIEYRDRSARSRNLGTAYDFNDSTAAARYCIPSGYSFRLFADSNLLGASTALRGDNTLAGDGNASFGAIVGFNWPSIQGWSSGCFVRSSAPTRCL